MLPHREIGGEGRGGAVGPSPPQSPQGRSPGPKNNHRRGPRQGTHHGISTCRRRAPRCGAVRQESESHERLSATDISALASMKNVAKCDTWCELQNPVNHRVFERKLRPRPPGRGHACLGVTYRVARPPYWTPLGDRRGVRAGDWPPVQPPWRCGRPKGKSPRAAIVTTSGGRSHCAISFGRRVRPSLASGWAERPRSSAPCAPTATPGQAGLPAEFKHINKRRRRNLRGFP